MNLTSAAPYGGALYGDTTAALSVTNSTFSGNSAFGRDGILNGGMATVTNSTFSGNSTQFAGGILNSSGTMTTMPMISSTTITVLAPAHAAGTVDIAVTTAGDTATIHGYTYLPASGGVSAQPGSHPLPGSAMPGVIVQPTRHDMPGSAHANVVGAMEPPPPPPNAQPGRH